jgi:ATP-dependent DNA helicase RecG
LSNRRFDPEWLLLLKKLEWEDFEFKLAKGDVPKDSWETVSAFANTNGGNLIFGIKETENGFDVSGIETPEKVSSDFLTTLRGEKFNIPLASRPRIFNIDGKTVMAFYIPGMPRQAKPIYFNEIRNTFIRHGGTDQRATKQEIERFLREASESSSDSMILPGASLSDLDPESIQRFINLFRNNLKNKVFSAFSEKDVLRKLGLVRQNAKKTQITAAAMLLLGNEEALKNWFPSFKVDYLEVPGIQWGGVGEIRWTYRILSESNLLESYIKIMPRLQMRVPMPFAMKKDGITRDEDSPVLLAIREGFVNLMAHADYFDRKGSFIKVFDDRIEMFNGGSLLFDVKLLSEGNISEPRNPLLIRTFRALNLAEEIGSGFVKIFDGWQAGGYEKPEIVSDRRNHFCRLIFDFKKPVSTEDDVSVKGDAPSANAPANHKGQPHIAPVKPQSAPVIAPVILGAIPQRIVDEIKKDRKINYNKLSLILSRNRTTIMRHISVLKKHGIIRRVGSDKSGYWEIIK